MHRFVHAQPFDVGPFEHAAEDAGFLTGHALGILQRDELDELGVVGRLDLLDQRAERKADPGNDHRPGFDAAQTIDALFERAQLHQARRCRMFWVFYFAFDRDRPRPRRQIFSILRRVAFVDAELVEIVVRSDVFERILLFIDAVRAFFDVRQFFAGVRSGRRS